MISRRAATVRIAAAATLAFPATKLAAAPAPIPVLEGAVSAKNAQGVFERVAGFSDKIIGLKATLDPAAGLVADRLPDEALVVFLSSTATGRSDAQKYQLSFAGGFVEGRGFVRLNGFFLVKYAGMGQGILAYQLEPVKESEVLLSGARLKTVRLR
ncbi:hypothetical protein [Chenggangzhangella methanolivorans]|uniref:Uncharacterized protein n=1 Tax=Chenggangzhangella methanolivorans TaxID=1437009 RepID=A0A9E6RB26_9HYPH|nr:hypothetical protein [Chenggangzhangella methanolivorans]QZO00927.1 hypothetical protein K6K41_04725 [Chenggangzhangella methanolivorans]